MTKKQHKEIQIITSMIEDVTKKPIIVKSELKKIEQKVDLILADISKNNKFFKRLI